jgi:tetratricopeptide (TPR) repeat protein
MGIAQRRDAGRWSLNGEHWFRVSVRVSLLIGLLFSTYLVIRQGIGALYFRMSSPAAIQTAIKWDPNNAQYRDALANLTHSYADNENPDDLIRMYETATRLSPYDAEYWSDLGAAYDWAGRSSDALRAFRRAVALFPNSPDINWRVANFYIRARDIPDGLRALRMVLLGISVPRRDVFALATNATRDNKAILDATLPSRANIFIDYINFLVETGKIDAAEETWARLLDLKLPFDLPESFPYLDGLIKHHEVAPLGAAWSTLAARFPAQIRQSTNTESLVTNGNFESAILYGGLDWRIVPIAGAVVSLDSEGAPEGARSLRIDFDGTHNLDYWHVYQFVPVNANTRYRFSAYMRVKGITTDSGPRFQIYDAYDPGKMMLSSENQVGTSDWSAQHLEFETGADTGLLVIRAARPVSHKFDNRIAGTVWIGRIRLDQD